jgi:hypothetical protein
MTTYSKQVYAGMPFQYKIVKDRYWDKVITKSIMVDTVDDVTLEPYDGVTITQDGSILTVSSGLLPNGNSYAGYKGVTAPAGKNYLTGADGILPGALRDDDGAMHNWNCFYNGETEFNQAQTVSGKVWLGSKVIDSHLTNAFPSVNFSQVGDVTYSDNAATFVDGTYLVSNKKLPNIEFFPQSFDFTAKITPKTPSGYNMVYRNATTNVCFGLYGSAWCIYTGSRKTGGTATADTAYWIKVQSIYNSSNSSYTSTLYVLTDNGSYTLETLPELSEWTNAVQVASNMFMSEEYFWLSNDGTYSFNGVIQLDQVELKTGMDGEWRSYWKPLNTNVITGA